MSIKLPFFKKKAKKSLNNESLNNVPSHVAVIMDGNGRWAKKRGLPRIAGHKEGLDAVQNTVRAANKYHIKVLTLFAFSTENWRRPQSEVDFLMRLPKDFFHIYLPELMEKNVRIEFIGDFDSLPIHTKKAVQNAKDQTQDNSGLLLNFALNYGGRLDMMHAVKQMIQDIDQSKLTIDSLDENTFSKYLYTNGLSDPDLLIRTSGEKRLSNFMLWQCAYSELWFTDTLWPDFTDVFLQALLDYQQRKRRYGGI